MKPLRNSDLMLSRAVGMGATLVAVAAMLLLLPGQAAVSDTLSGTKQSVGQRSGFDTDGDGVTDDVDNCTLISNPNQRDTNGDGFGNFCDPDLNNDCIVTTCPGDPNPILCTDLGTDGGLFAADFFQFGDLDADFNGDDIVNFLDLNIFVSFVGLPPGPSAGAECDPVVEDEDGDSVADGDDLCPGTAAAAAVDDNGCSDAQVDSDSDGICDPTALSNGFSMCVGSDNCPDDANPNQDDFDMDGIGDACDTGCFGNLFVRTKAESGGAQVNLVWAPVPTATSYDILRSDDGPASGFAVIAAEHTTNFATYLDKIPPPLSAQYWYKVVPNGAPVCLSSDAVRADLSSRLPP